MRWAVLALAAVAVIALLWLAGEQHRKNCVQEDRVSCSVLPWDNGEPRGGTNFDEIFNNP